MYCTNCGNELARGTRACGNCGSMVAEAPDAVRESARGGITPSASGADYTSWEYARTSVGDDLAQVTTDCYESLGFELTGAKSDIGDASTLSFRRSRKMHGKAQLTKLQRTMDDLIASIARLEADKTRKGRVQALSMGILFALVFGVGMCCTMVWTSLMIPGIVIGLVGIAGCVAAYFTYRRTCAKEAARINPRIEAAYDSLATACEEAQAVLRTQG